MTTNQIIIETNSINNEHPVPILSAQIIEALYYLDTIDNFDKRDLKKADEAYQTVTQALKQYGEVTSDEEMITLSNILDMYYKEVFYKIFRTCSINLNHIIVSEQIKLMLINILYRIKFESFRKATKSTLNNGGYENIAFVGDSLKSKPIKNDCPGFELEYVSSWHSTDNDSAILTFADVREGTAKITDRLDIKYKKCYNMGDITTIEYK